jgi:hypothetical protein
VRRFWPASLHSSLANTRADDARAVKHSSDFSTSSRGSKAHELASQSTDSARGTRECKNTTGTHLRLLIDARSAWVALPQIMACAAQYNARIFELRRRGFSIENRTETDFETGVRHSWFRLVNPPARCSIADPKPAHDAPESDLGDWYESTTGKPRPDETASADDLPLFAATRR